MQTVYRLEHKDTGIGPYHSHNDNTHDWRDDMLNKHNNCINHPLGHEDVPFTESKYIFGFDSLYKLEQWFSGYIHLLTLEAGFIIKEYKSEDVIVGDSNLQLVFIPLEDTYNR